MHDDEEGVEIREDETSAGFSVRTLTYRDAFELPLSGKDAPVRHDRCVALLLDDENRCRRRRSGEGYVHERLGDRGWSIVAEFESLAGLTDTDVYRRYQRSLPGVPDPA